MKRYSVRERMHQELIPDLLHARGILGEEETARFLKPDFERDSHDPFLLPGMERAVERIRRAVAAGEQVCVWSDYDCDGIPGGVLLTEFLRAIGLSVLHYIPHRHKEGFGLNVDGLAEVAGTGVTLVITVDLGTSDADAVAFAREKGMDVIITDHHLPPPGGGLPEAFAIVNPMLPGSAYPFRGLCGAGVAWKLVQAVLARGRFGLPEGWEKWLLDLAGIATLSDMVPLRDENRMLAHFGLRVMRRARRPGLAALLSMLRIKPQSLTEDDIGFMVSPRLNAASRMDSPELAARLLASADKEEAGTLARQLDAINNERKGVVAATVKEVNRRLAQGDMVESPIIVMGNPNWRPGVLGLVANSLMEAHGKPVFLWGREGGALLRGSCRSAGSVNVVELMGAAADVFDHFGGHHNAGGFALSEERAHELAPRLAAAYGTMDGMVREQEIVLERELDLEEISRAHRELFQLAPFGMENQKPLFLIPRVSISRMRTFGKASDHLELQFSRGASRISGVSFFSTADSFSKSVSDGISADIVGHVETDWRGAPRLRVVDVI